MNCAVCEKKIRWWTRGVPYYPDLPIDTYQQFFRHAYCYDVVSSPDIFADDPDNMYYHWTDLIRDLDKKTDSKWHLNVDTDGGDYPAFSYEIIMDGDKIGTIHSPDNHDNKWLVDLYD